MFDDDEYNPWTKTWMRINLAAAAVASAIKGRLTFLFILHLIAMWFMLDHFLGCRMMPVTKITAISM